MNRTSNTAKRTLQQNKKRQNYHKKDEDAHKFKLERIQKLLAQTGLGSRREIETWIIAKRVKVNKKIAELGQKITVMDYVEVDGKRIHFQHKPQQTRILILNKPAGFVCTRKDPEGRPTVFSLDSHLKSHRWIMIGRLDFNTSGLLLFTNNGELAHRLMHPSTEIEREYAVRILGEVNKDVIRKLLQGVSLDDGLARFNKIEDAGGEGKNHWYHVILKEGKYREVRRLWESQGFTVTRLIRIRYGFITLPRYLRQGRVIELEADQVLKLSEFIVSTAQN